MAEIFEAYAPFAQALRRGGFGDLVDPGAWPAELVAAHVVLSLDEAVSTLRASAAGADAAYDDAVANDRPGLRRYLISTGSLQELAVQVERAAADVDAAYDALGATERSRQISVRMYHQTSVEDRTMSIDQLIAELAGAHAERHLSELADIEDIHTADV